MSTIVQSQVALQSNLFTALIDTQTREPFKEAQIVDCLSGHSFDLAIAQKIFGQLKNGKCERPGFCPDCMTLSGKKANVTTYSPNIRLQQLVDAVLNPKILEKTVSIEQKNELCNYPFEACRFKLESIGGQDTGERERWDLNFVAENENSPIQSFQIFISIPNPYWNKELKDPKFYLNVHLLSYLDAEKFSIYANNITHFKIERINKSVSFDTTKNASYLEFIDKLMANNSFKENEMKRYEEEMKEMMSSVEEAIKDLSKKKSKKKKEEEDWM